MVDTRPCAVYAGPNDDERSKMYWAEVDDELYTLYSPLDEVVVTTDYDEVGSAGPALLTRFADYLNEREGK